MENFDTHAAILTGIRDELLKIKPTYKFDIVPQYQHIKPNDVFETVLVGFSLNIRPSFFSEYSVCHIEISGEKAIVGSCYANNRKIDRKIEEMHLADPNIIQAIDNALTRLVK